MIRAHWDHCIGTSLLATALFLAKEGVRRTLELLYDKDELGIIGFDNEVEWALPLTAGPKRGAVERALERLSPRGGTDICPGLVEAHAALAASPNELRHMVLLTDGQSAPGDFDLVLRDCLRDGISISSVGIGDTVDKALLAAIARRAGGRLFLASNASELPRIFTKDALTATRSLLVERRFVPRRIRKRFDQRTQAVEHRGVRIEVGQQCVGDVRCVHRPVLRREAASQVEEIRLQVPLGKRRQFGRRAGGRDDFAASEQFNAA